MAPFVFLKKSVYIPEGTVCTWIIFKCRLLFLDNFLFIEYNKVKESQFIDPEGGRDMAKMSDLIEVFIKELLEDSVGDPVEIQRNELAGYFKCAPSQINYVLTTRFSMDKGYLIESQRGGGGSIKIIKLEMSEEDFLVNVLKEIGDSITKLKADQIVDLVMDRNMISEREARLIKSATADRSISAPVNIKNEIRAGILKGMLLSVSEG